MSGVTFVWPYALVGLALVPVLVWLYGRRLRDQAKRRAEYAAMGLVPVTPARRAWVAPVLMLLGVTLALGAMARPTATVPEPRREGTVVLAFDVSTSMTAPDIAPTRLDAAKAAALAFVERQPENVKVGVVAFGAVAMVTQTPTLDKTAVTAAIKRLQPSGSTSVGRGLIAGISAIAGKNIQLTDGTEQDIGWYGGSTIVILSDGEETGGPDPLELADLASTAGIRIHTVGLGTPSGTQIKVDGFTLSTRLDEGLLRQIAETTDGSYHQASDEAGLRAVYEAIELSWTIRQVPHEVTSWVVSLALLLVAAGAGWSIVRTGRVI